MNKSRIWLLVVVLLLLVNTVVLAMLWMKKHPAAMPEGGGGGAKDFLISELRLTTAQQDKYDALREDHQKQTRAAMEGMRELKDELAEKISAAQTDTAAIESLTRSISEKERQRDLITFYHFRSFRAILTKEQQEKFDGILKQVLRMMSGPQRPQGPPPGEKKDRLPPGNGEPQHPGEQGPPEQDGPPQ